MRNPFLKDFCTWPISNATLREPAENPTEKASTWDSIQHTYCGVAMDNEMRINRAITALKAAYPEEEDDLVSKIDDLLTDIMHLCRQEGIEFQRCVTVAEVNCESEK
jgi:hypothetical protein